MTLSSLEGHFQSNREAFQKSMETPSWSRRRVLLISQVFPQKLSVSNSRSLEICVTPFGTPFGKKRLMAKVVKTRDEAEGRSQPT